MLRTGTALATTIGAALLALASLVAGGSQAGDVGGGAALLLHTSAVSPHESVRATGSEVAVAGVTVSFPAPVRDLAVTDGGLYVLAGDRLWVTDGHVVLRTGVSGMARVVASADGRYLGFVERTGPGTRTVSVYDTTTGQRVVHEDARGGSVLASILPGATPVLRSR